MQTIKHIDTWGNGMKIYRVQPGAEACVQHGAILVKGNQTFSVGTSAGYLSEGYGRGFDGYSADYLARDRAADDKEFWINQRCTTICAGTHPDATVCALEVEIGDVVHLEGKRFEIASAPNRNLKLIEAA